MAKSKYEYVRKFEQNDQCLMNCWIVIRIDGRNFHRFSDGHCFEKPNDQRALQLMNKCAETVMREFTDIVISYGQSLLIQQTLNLKMSFINVMEKKCVLFTAGHINNLYNTCFWCLVKQSGLTAEKAEERLNGTVSSDKNELLFSEFNMNYNNLPQIYRKGSVLVWERVCDINDTAREENVRKPKRQIVIDHTDIIGDTFWNEHPEILDS
ncbi:probable tRNA(His) guanylyltransferase [Stylophora pistillata]|uniref:probable tRNA(His) guanylyltransferase n=1 Tax=Stylophora pistillata TaxID=50429 RepID=UPI000C04A3A8|nr:probable tRNA(His) guanylyltransferase [Stylophora pistillata]